MNWDNVHAKKNNLYYVRENQKYDTYTATFSSTPGILAPAMQAGIPGIANTCRTSEEEMSLLLPSIINLCMQVVNMLNLPCLICSHCRLYKAMQRLPFHNCIHW